MFSKQFNDHIVKILLICLGMLLMYIFLDMIEEPDADCEDIVETLVDSGFELSSDREKSDLLDNRIIVITTDINANSARMIISRLLLLEKKDAGAPIDIYLRTEGGWEADAFSIIDAISNLGPSVHIHALGEVHSSGCMIFAAATGNRIVYRNTILGFHTPAEDEDKIFLARYVRFWKKYANLPKEWLNRTDEEMIYFNARDAIKYGIADILYTEDKITDNALVH